MTEALLDAGFRVSFADHSPRSIVEVTRKYKDRPGFLGAYHVDDLNPLESSADLVIMIELIEHLYDEPLNLAVQQAGKMLGPSGKFLSPRPMTRTLMKVRFTVRNAIMFVTDGNMLENGTRIPSRSF